MQDIQNVRSGLALSVLSQILLKTSEETLGAFQLKDAVNSIRKRISLANVNKGKECGKKRESKQVLQYLLGRADELNLPLFNTFLVGLLLHEWEYLQAIKYFSMLSASHRGCRLDMELLRLELDDYLRYSARLRADDSQKMVCVRLGASVETDVKRAFQAEQVTLALIGSVEDLLRLKAELNEALLNTGDGHFATVEALMLRVERAKADVARFAARNAHCQTQRRFAAAYYVFLRSGCKLHYQIPRLMDGFFSHERTEGLQSSAAQRALVCLVSGESDSIGTILNANVSLKEFFGISQEKIQARSEKVERILPDVLVEKHNELMVRFKRTGVSSVLGKIR